MSSIYPESDRDDNEAEPYGRDADEYFEAITNMWEHAMKVFGSDGLTSADIRLTVHRRGQETVPIAKPDPRPADSAAAPLVPQLRWLLTQSAGTIADAAHRLETGGGGLDEQLREQLRDDVLVIDEELAALKALLVAPADWDAEYGRLLAGEVPPLESDSDDED
jgi:hypothetical protein